MNPETTPRSAENARPAPAPASESDERLPATTLAGTPLAPTPAPTPTAAPDPAQPGTAADPARAISGALGGWCGH